MEVVLSTRMVIPSITVPAGVVVRVYQLQEEEGGG